MRPIPREKLLLYLVLVVLVILLVPMLSRFPRRGRSSLWHLGYVAAIPTALVLLPEWIQTEIFSPGGVLVIGTVLPVYETIVAVCTIEEHDDKAWLQYWITAGTFSFASEFMDEITHILPQAGEHWYEFEFFATLWLLLPMTNGVSILYERITKPYITPLVGKLKLKIEGWA